MGIIDAANKTKATIISANELCCFGRKSISIIGAIVAGTTIAKTETEASIWPAIGIWWNAI